MATEVVIEVGGGRANVRNHHHRDAVLFTAAVPGDWTAATWNARLRHNPLLAEAIFTVTVGAFAAGATVITVDLQEPAVLGVPVGVHRWRLWRRFAGRTKTILSGEWETVPADG